jgi:diguanylate cyclase (GGDEF)-like protein/PAS domain S-box-containing protein
MKLSTFILDNIEPILQEWENFAQTIFEDKQTTKILRDDAKQMLLAFALDLQQEQSKSEQTAKSKGRQPQIDTAAEKHGVGRFDEGFSILDLAAEYRALRASVTKLWGNAKKAMHASDINDLVHFNEAIDQALNESIFSYSSSKEQQTRHLSTMLSFSPDLSYVIGLDGVFLYVNEAMSTLHQKPANEMVGMGIYDLADHSMAEEQSRIQSVIDTGEPQRGDRVFYSPSGSEYFFECIYTPIFDENGQIEAIAGNSRDITERKLAEARIWHVANYDVLTDLPNRRLFSDRLDQAIKQAMREDKRFALFSIDLDRFKTVNDNLGHGAGDILLKQAGERIKACIRDMDTVARMGGDEFTVLLTNVCNAEQVKIVAGKILHELTKPFQIKHEFIDISGSLGIALYPQDGVDSETLLGNADRALYDAKNSGRNQYKMHSSAEA